MTQAARGDRAGFDVLPFDEYEETEHFIKVKTTRLGKPFPFYVTANEVRCGATSPLFRPLLRPAPTPDR